MQSLEEKLKEIDRIRNNYDDCESKYFASLVSDTLGELVNTVNSEGNKLMMAQIPANYMIEKFGSRVVRELINLRKLCNDQVLYYEASKLFYVILCYESVTARKEKDKKEIIDEWVDYMHRIIPPLRMLSAHNACAVLKLTTDDVCARDDQTFNYDATGSKFITPSYARQRKKVIDNWLDFSKEFITAIAYSEFRSDAKLKTVLYDIFNRNCLNLLQQCRCKTVDEILEFQLLDLPKNYTVVRKLGEGRVSKVYLARNKLKNKKEVALKIVKIKEQPDIMSVATRQLELLDEVKSPYVLRCYEPFEHEGKLVLPMEVYEKNLRQRLDECNGKGLPFLEAMKYFEQMLEGLAECHSKGIIHQDLCPDNIGIDKERNIKLTDFNASVYEETREIKFGALDYSSPKVLEGSRTNAKIEKEDNNWSLGVILYELLAGKKVFAPTEKTDSIQAFRDALIAQQKIFEANRDETIKKWVNDISLNREEIIRFEKACLGEQETDSPNSVFNNSSKYMLKELPVVPMFKDGIEKRTRDFLHYVFAECFSLSGNDLLSNFCVGIFAGLLQYQHIQPYKKDKIHFW